MKTKKLNPKDIRKNDVVVFTNGRKKKLILVTLISKSGRIYGDDVLEIQGHPEIFKKSPSNRINPYLKSFPEQHRVYTTSLSIQPGWYFRTLTEKEYDEFMASKPGISFNATIDKYNGELFFGSGERVISNYRISVYNTKGIITSIDKVFRKMKKIDYYLYAHIRQKFTYLEAETFEEETFKETFKDKFEAHLVWISLNRDGIHQRMIIGFSNGHYMLGSWSMPLNTNHEKVQCIALLRKHEILPTAKSFSKASLSRH